MCTMSMVFDHYDHRIPKWPSQWHPVPTPAEKDDLLQLIEEFKEAAAAAKIVDKFLGQPDCETLAKTKLWERIQIIEKELTSG